MRNGSSWLGCCPRSAPGSPLERSPDGHRRCLVPYSDRVPGRDLPEGYGNWKTVYDRHRRWSLDGTWERVLDSLRAGCDEAEVRTGRSARTRPWCAGISTRPARRPGRHIGDGKTRRATGAPAAGGAAARPAFDPGCYKQRNTVERCFSKLKQFRAVATRYDKRERIVSYDHPGPPGPW